MRQGMGVMVVMLMRAMQRGMCPFLAPTKNSLGGGRTGGRVSKRS